MSDVQEVRVRDLAGVSEIAARAGVSVNTVQAWRRRYTTFPLPAITLSAGPIWDWSEIAGWIAARRRYERRSAGRHADWSRYEGVPGYELVATGAADVSAGRETIAAELVRSASQRLAKLGFDIPRAEAGEAPRLYQLIVDEVGGTRAHGRYNALRRRLASFLRSAPLTNAQRG